MDRFLGDFSGTDLVFAAFAFVGTFFFFLRMAWMFMAGLDDGGGHAHEAGVGHTTDAHSSESAFNLISVNTVTALFMMFGWIGLACSRQFALGVLPSVTLGFLAGVASMALTAYLLSAALKLASPGERFQIHQAVGLTASVYQKIPAHGKGKIQVVVRGVGRELEAVSEQQEEIASFQNVMVLRAIDHQTVSVVKTA